MELRELHTICKQAEFKDKDMNKAFERAITPTKVSMLLSWIETQEKLIAQLEEKAKVQTLVIERLERQIHYEPRF